MLYEDSEMSDFLNEFNNENEEPEDGLFSKLENITKFSKLTKLYNFIGTQKSEEEQRQEELMNKKLE